MSLSGIKFTFMKERVAAFLEEYGDRIKTTKGWKFYSLLVIIFLLPMGSILCLIALYIRWKGRLFKH